MGNFLILSGIILAVTGALLNLLAKIKAPLIPGDILIQKGNLTFYFPIVTSIILSLILTFLINLFRK